VKEVCSDCERPRWLYASQPDAADVYEWGSRLAKIGPVIVHVMRFSDAAQAREYVRTLTIAAPQHPVNGIGDVAFIATMGGLATVHMSVREYYLQLSAQSYEGALAVAQRIAAAMVDPF